MALTTTSIVAPIHALKTLRLDQRATHTAFEKVLVTMHALITDLKEKNMVLTSEIEVLKGRLALLDTEKSAFEEYKSASEARINDLTKRLEETHKIFALLRHELVNILASSQRYTGLAGPVRFMAIWNASPTIKKISEGVV